jgi:glycosyltransferase involved in cell wall biosynthesis
VTGGNALTAMECLNISNEPRTKILLVDDQSANLVALRAILEPLEQEIIEAQSGKEALRQLLQHEVAVVLLDIQMPDLDGFEVVQQVRRFSDVQPIARYRDGTLNIFFVGRFEPRKGLMYLLKAYRALRKRGYNCRLLVAGSGPQEREVRRYIATRRLQGVELLGRVSDEDKARYFATADVYVSPATGQESFGIVLLEAMAAGAPIVCSDIHGYKGVVRRGEQALLVPPRDVNALVEAIARLLDDAELRARMSAAGRARAVQFGWENITAKVEEYYSFVIRRQLSLGSLPQHVSSTAASAAVRSTPPAEGQEAVQVSPLRSPG